MTGNEILILLAVLGLGAIVVLVVRARARALPPAPAPSKALGKAAPAKEEPAPAPAASEPEAPTPTSDEREEEEEEAERAAPEEPEADVEDAAAESGPRSDADTAEDGPLVPPEPEPQPAEPKPRPRKAIFTPPPLPGARAAVIEPPAPTVEPRRAVPLPVDKPRTAAAPDPAEDARREQERERYRQGLAKTRGGFVAKLARIFKGRPKVDANLRDRIEEVLLTSDIGTATAEKLQQRVTKVLDNKDVADPDAVWSVIRQAVLELLEIDAPKPDYTPEPGPYVLLMIGVNGVGKTTTLGKLAAQHTRAGRKVLLVAGDTFRAAAVEQLDVWARRVGCTLHAGADKADPSSVIYEGITRGRREGFDVVLCDTAGRLHTRKELMDELAKVGRAAAKAIAKGQPESATTGAHDTYLVLDATIGQNALAQAHLFKETMGFTGLVITKLDGTAKGGVVLGVCDELRIPVRYVGIGEGIEDLRAFDAEDFTDALLADRDRAELADPPSP